MAEFHIDGDVLAELFGLRDVEHTTVRGTLSGRPYIALRVLAPKGVRDGAVLFGTARRNPNGSYELAYKAT